MIRQAFKVSFIAGFTGGVIGGGMVSYWGFRHLGKHHHEVFRKFYEQHKR
jgi:hypothetical protein